ncbi:MAG: hypothetical protein HZA03_04370 [Nitrospinae bacterium]|nr:hypothetical protein [Nitrospinota bacterium]
MKKVTECAVCAWRAECKIKFSYESSGLYCKEFTRDLAFGPAEEDVPDKDVAKKDETGKREKPKKE